MNGLGYTMLELKCIKEDFFGNGYVIYKDEERKVSGLIED